MVEFLTLQDEACRMAADAMRNAARERDMYICMTLLRASLPAPALTTTSMIQRSARVWPPEIFHAREKYKVALKQLPKIFCLA
jgi:hypothetical protein